MAARARFFRLAFVGMLLTACDQDPVGLQQAAERSVVERASSGAAASSAGMNKSSIQGVIGQIALLPGDTRITPSGRCHFRGVSVINSISGDVTGTLTFFENEHAPCDFSDLVGSGPVQGLVTWNGRSGVVAGQWTTNCDADASQPIGLSCDGVMNLRGSGGLDGVQFHFAWGPGWYPFPYTGTAFAR
jgi:hypothetical protein